MTTNTVGARVAVVTGAGGTLCSALALELAIQGIKVALIGRTKSKLEIVRDEIEAQGGTAMVISADVVDREAIKKARQEINSKWGACSILINGAGGNQMSAVTTQTVFEPEELGKTTPDKRGFFNIDLDVFQDVVLDNTMGTVIPCQVFGEDMAKNQKGVIINFASMNTFRPLSRVAAYGMAKAGIGNFTQWLASYLAPANIRVNAIAPGFFINDRSKKILLDAGGQPTDRGESILRQTPLKRFGQARELIGCMNWLIDEEASGFVTGTILPIDGGFMADSGI
ncbi:MAG: SDR family NAD(P)-dependent oxidoreductase [Cytophagales bacterium]|uniref:SDR family NAD(P)-dependent oxidoreductase n=1 Tax=Cyclobacterium marinum TaxID=104 RepID=UPI0030D7A800|nr:SDR family NAD(P)-dependent oxidoreductase [Cytophagales bacterium]|tara:strand:- start:11895 stop:12743 length:849 start_codon:yes stop_codon:yes gene_type:complete